jgi:hypothetical protein
MTVQMAGSRCLRLGESELRRTQLKRLVVSLFAITAGLLAFTGGSVHAQESEFAIQVRVLDQQRDASGRADNQPVEGVTITVVDADGTEVGTGVTDERGIALIRLPARADYVVRLDESTLPEDTGLIRRVDRRGDRDPGVVHHVDDEHHVLHRRVTERRTKCLREGAHSAWPTGSGSGWCSPCARSACR